MDFARTCSLHGPGLPAHDLVGRRLVEVMASWFRHGDGDREGPLEVWLIGEDDAPISVTAGSDWCLIVDRAEPHDGWAFDDIVVDVTTIGRRTPLAAHLGERVTAACDERHPYTGRMAIELAFPTGGVRLDSWGGDLRIQAI